MSNKQELRNQLIHYFENVGSGQNLNQCLKQVLFSQPHFNPVLLFEKLSHGKQYITDKNWRDYLIEIHLQSNQRQFKYFMKHNQYKSKTNLNQFLQSIIPYNGDKLRQYKKRCLDSIKINQYDQNVADNFSNVIESQFKLFKTLINIRDQISAIANLKDIQKLIKQDILDDVDHKPRQHRKLQQTFQQKNFKIGFSQLRKFFDAWDSKKKTTRSLCMLNIMRHLKSNDPLSKIIFTKKRKNLSANKNSAIKQSRSPSANKQTPYASKQKRQQQAQQSPYAKHLNASGPQQKYNDFKDQLLNQFQQKRNQKSSHLGVKKSNKKQSLQNSYQKQKQPRVNNGYSEEREARQRPQSYGEFQESTSKYKQHEPQLSRLPQKTFSEASGYILNFLEEIVVKEQKLQKLRKDLAKHNDFNLINLYKLIDSKNKGYITSRDIANFPDSKHAQYLYMVDFYGRQKDKLLFHEFCQIFRPLSRQLNEAIDSRPQNKCPDPFKNQTRRLIIEILKLTADEHFNLQKRRESMYRIDPKEMFIFLDVHNKGYIDADALLTVFAQNGIYCDDKILKCLLKLFKKRIDERITFNQFVKLIEN